MENVPQYSVDPTASPVQNVQQTPDALRQQLEQQTNYIRQQTSDGQREQRALLQGEISLWTDELSAVNSSKFEEAATYAAGGFLVGLFAVILFKRKGGN